MEKDLKRILIIQTAFLGDVVLATPLVEALHRHYPQAEIDFVLKKGNESLLKGHPHLRQVLVFDKARGKIKNLLQLLGKIRGNRYELVINLHRFASSGIMSAFSGAPDRRGFDKNPLSVFYTHSLAHQIGGAHPLHETERNLQLIGDIAPEDKRRPVLYPTPADYRQVQPLQQQGPYLCIAPTSVWFTKQFPEEKWVALLRQLPRHLHIYLIGGPADAEICQRIARQGGHPLSQNLAGQLSLLQSAALMQQALLNYVNDSGPMHLASAVNGNTCAIFCSTVPAFGFGPRAVGPGKRYGHG